MEKQLHCFADLTDHQEAEKMQQQLLTLLSEQIQDLKAVHPHIASNSDSLEQVTHFFAQEASAISKEATELSGTMCAGGL